MTKLIRWLFVLLCLGGIAAGLAWFKAREDEREVGRAFAERAREVAQQNAELRQVHIKSAEDLYKMLIEVEKTSYEYSTKIATNRIERDLVEIKREITLLRIQYQRDRAIAEAKEKYP